MMTREEIKEIVDYSQEHGITIKRRLQELNVSESNFYYAKRMYAREDMVPGVEGCSTGEPHDRGAQDRAGHSNARARSHEL